MDDPKYTDNYPGPCAQKISDMRQYGRSILDKWPRYFKETLGKDIENEMLMMLRLATKGRLHYMNQSTLKDLDVSKAMLDAFLREANATMFTDRKGEKRRLLTNQSFGVWTGYTSEIGKLIGAWIKSTADRKDHRR